MTDADTVVREELDDELFSDKWGWIFSEGPLWRRLLAWSASIVIGLLLAAWLAYRSDDMPLPGVIAVITVALAAPVLTIVDTATKLLPNAFIYPAYTVAGFGAILTALGTGELGSVATAAGVGLAGWFVYFIIWFAAPAGGFGFGDVRLSGLLGFALGFHSWALAFVGLLVVPLLLAIPVGAIATWASRHSEAKATIPFGPMMLAGAVACLAFPELFTSIASTVTG